MIHFYHDLSNFCQKMLRDCVTAKLLEIICSAYNMDRRFTMRRFLVIAIVVGALLFVSAGTSQAWGGWSFGFSVGYPYGGFGQQYQPTEIPQQVKDAQCEFAFEFLNGFNDGDEAEVKQFSDDKMSVTFDRPRQPGELPAEVSRLISGLTAQNKRVRG